MLGYAWYVRAPKETTLPKTAAYELSIWNARNTQNYSGYRRVQLQTVLFQSIGAHQFSVAQAALTPHEYTCTLYM